MNKNTLAFGMALAMCAVSVAGVAMQPSSKARDKGNSFSLEASVPKSFGDWAEVRDQVGQVVNPQTQELLDKLYSQLLTRTYVNKQGYRIMLSMAYGDDQRGGLAAHRPEVCYPAQGFAVLGNVLDDKLNTPLGSIDVRRLNTVMGERKEPVTYWLTVGDAVNSSAWAKRMTQIRLGLTGQIPDGLLFRVSSIDNDSVRAYEMQNRFVTDMMATVPAETRKQLSGLGAPASGG